MIAARLGQRFAAARSAARVAAGTNASSVAAEAAAGVEEGASILTFGVEDGVVAAATPVTVAAGAGGAGTTIPHFALCAGQPARWQAAEQ